MKILSHDFKKGPVRLLVTDKEDLWYLSHLIDPGDLVRGKTTRKIKIGEGDNAKTVKKTLTLTVEAETIELDESGISLRVNGKVKEGPEDVPQDSYHAISLEDGSEFTLEKSLWLKYQQQKLQEAATPRYKYLLCLFDREEMLLALTGPQGYEILLKLQGDVIKKDHFTAVKKDFQQEIIVALQRYTERYHPERIVVASPAFYKDDLGKKITSSALKQKIIFASCSDISERSLDEVLKQPELAKVLQGSRVREEQLLMDELLREINKDHFAVYGWKETKIALEANAVRVLLLTDKFIHERRVAKTFAELDELMKGTDQLQGEIRILSSAEEPGKKLDGLGGIAALLRYKLWNAGEYNRSDGNINI